MGGRAYSEEPTEIVPEGNKQHQTEDAMLGKTLSGRRYWGDVHNFRGWRIQQNTHTKQHRLIDSAGLSLTTGAYDDCQQALNKIREEKQLAGTSGPAVIMIHGLLQSSRCMADMGNTLRDAGYTTIDFDYPSTQINITEAASYLDRTVRSLEGFDEINFVVHSMGGLVVRAFAAEHNDPRIKRMVMLGTPNQGAEMANITQQYWIFRAVAGPSARQLRTGAAGLAPKLPVPNFEFAVIAGSRGTPAGWNPFIPGDDDGTVTVESTRLPGASDFSTVRSIHSRLLWNAEAIAQTVFFLKEGRLRPDAPAQPIEVDQTTTSRGCQIKCHLEAVTASPQ